jgi:hypothetical protein
MAGWRCETVACEGEFARGGKSYRRAVDCRKLIAAKRSSLVSLGTNEAEIFGQARRFRVALTWALEIVAYGRSGMLVGCVGTGELKLQGSENECFVKLASSVR